MKLKLWAVLALVAAILAAFIGYALADVIKKYAPQVAAGLLVLVVVAVVAGAIILVAYLYHLLHKKVIEPRADLKMQQENNKITNQLRTHEVQRAAHIAALFNSLVESETANFQLKTTDLDLNVIRTLQQAAPHYSISEPSEEQAQIGGPAQKQIAPAPTAPDPLDLVDLARPATKKVTIAFSNQGPVLVDLSKGEHLWLGGPTGKGKTTELRFLLLQIAPIAETYLLSPHYAPVKALSNGTLQDWRPIQKYLAEYPSRTAADLERRLRWALLEMDRRYLAEEQGDYSWRFSPVYIAIDEWPEIVNRYANAADDIAAILRRGRHVGVCVINTSQSALVKVNGGSSSDRNQYGVVINFGLNTSEANAMRANIANVASTDLGDRGLVICRAGDVEPTLARVPWVSNAGLYAWLEYPDDPVSDSPVENGHFRASGSNLSEQTRTTPIRESIESTPVQSVQDDLRASANYRRFAQMRASGTMNKSEIIFSIWGARPGASQAWKNASNLYDRFVDLYNEQIVDAGAITIESESM